MNKIILTEENSILEILELKKPGIEQIKTELQKTVDFSKLLLITDFEDKNQFELIKSTKNGYVKTRNTIKRAFKSKRDEYNVLAKENLEAEREVISVIEGEEKRLDDMVSKAELLKLRKDNEVKLEERINALIKVEAEYTQNDLLEMSDKVFNEVLSIRKDEYINKKQKEEEDKLAKIAREKELEEAKKQARLEAEQEAKRQAEIEFKRVELEKEKEAKKVIKEKEEAETKRLQDLENARIEKENEIARIKKQQEQKEIAEKKRKEDEEKTRLEAEQTEKDNQARLEKEKKYIAYRNILDYDKIEKEDGKIVFYKKVGEFII